MKTISALLLFALALVSCADATTTYDPTLVCDFSHENSSQDPPTSYADCGTAIGATATSIGTPCVVCTNPMRYGAAWTYKRTGDLACEGDVTYSPGFEGVRGSSYVICLPGSCAAGDAAGCK